MLLQCWEKVARAESPTAWQPRRLSLRKNPPHLSKREVKKPHGYKLCDLSGSESNSFEYAESSLSGTIKLLDSHPFTHTFLSQ